jgi:hypothetical protein
LSETIQLSKEDLEDLELLRAVKRASQGLSIIEQDIMTFLVDTKNHRERTRLSEHNVYGYSGWEELAGIFPKTFGFLCGWSMLECIYFIALDGLQRQEAILMTKAKIQAQTPLTIENIQGQPVPQPEEQKQQKGRSLFHPFRKAT